MARQLTAPRQQLAQPSTGSDPAHLIGPLGRFIEALFATSPAFRRFNRLSTLVIPRHEHESGVASLEAFRRLALVGLCQLPLHFHFQDFLTRLSLLKYSRISRPLLVTRTILIESWHPSILGTHPNPMFKISASMNDANSWSVFNWSDTFSDVF